MMFTEAAVEVLRLVGRPLHYKKITEIAIERNLLSHVGKAPEITMSSRLATMVKKDRGDAPIVKVKPGVFGLREFTAEVLAMGELEPGDVEEILEAIDDHEEPAEAPVQAQPEGEAPAEAPAPAPPKPKAALPGQDVFPEEEGDDEPILGRDDATDKAAKPAGDDESRRGKKRRRKRRGREDGDDDAPEAPAREERSRDDRPREERGRETRDDRSRDDRGREGRDRDGRDRDRGRDRGRDGREPRDGRDARDGREGRREPEIRGDWQRGPESGDLLGKELADAIEASFESRPVRRTFAQVAESLVAKGRLAGDAAALAPTIAAAVRGDIARRSVRGDRPRFRVRFGEVMLTETLVSQDVARAEQELAQKLARHRDLMVRALIRKLLELPNASLLEVLATWLNAVGVTALRGVRKPGAQPGEFHLAGVLRRGPEELPLAIVVVRDGAVGRERIVDVRGSLHRYGDARAAWVVALGNVQGGAREEVDVPAAVPVALFDGERLARSMEEVGVGLRRYTLPVLSLDHDLFDELRGPGAPPRAPREERADREERRPRPEREASEPRDEVDDTDADGDGPSESDDPQPGGAARADEPAAGTDEENGRRRRRRRRKKKNRGGPEGAAAGGAEGGEATDDADGDAEGDVEDLGGDDDAAPAREERREHGADPAADDDEGTADDPRDADDRDDDRDLDEDDDVDRDLDDDRDDADRDLDDEDDDELDDRDDEEEDEIDDRDDDELDDAELDEDDDAVSDTDEPPVDESAELDIDDLDDER